jgi:hypothetical protein
MFPTQNAMSVSRYLIQAGPVVAMSVSLHQLQSGQYNLFSVPAVVDVSGMEFSVGVALDASSGGTPGLAVATADGSRTLIAFQDGGPTGDATGNAVLHELVSNTASAWVANVPRDVTGTSTTDLDADDWVNILMTDTGGNGATAVGALELTVAYIYGKPGVIN